MRLCDRRRGLRRVRARQSAQRRCDYQRLRARSRSPRLASLHSPAGGLHKNLSHEGHQLGLSAGAGSLDRWPQHLRAARQDPRRVGEGEDAYRGRDGNLTVTTMDWKDPLCEAFMAGAISLGIPRNPDYNGAIQEGVSYAQRTIKNGLRVSAATAFLHPAMKRPNVRVRTHVHATEILFEGKRAVGVRYIKGGRHGTATEVRANKEVILAGGAYNSPQLLQLSGVGSPELLRSLGVH